MTRPLVVLAVVSFFLHLVWEKTHIALYTGYEAMEGVLPVYVFATVGDVAYVLAAVLLVALFKGGIRWLRDVRATDYAGLAVLGLSIALFVEYKAAALGRWEYTDAMPLVHGLGLSPLAQMTVLLPLSVFITIRIERWLQNRPLR